MTNLVYILTFNPWAYPNERRILGVYRNEDTAKAMIDAYIKSDRLNFPKHPNRYEQNKHCYEIDVHETLD